MVTVTIALPEYALTIIDELRHGGYEAWAVGGAVRDSLLGRIPEDWDITTSARPDEVCACLKAAGIRVICTSGLKHGTVTAVLDDTSHSCEITTYRSEERYSDNRHPDGVRFISDLSSDLARRDFTVNAIAADSKRIIDPFLGRIDLERRVLRTVGEPTVRFREDALRILRGLRFASQLGFALEPDTLCAMKELSSLVPSVSAERRLTELDKLLAGGYAAGVIRNYGDILCRSLGLEAQYGSLLDAAEQRALPQDRDVLFVLFFGERSEAAADALKLPNRRKKAVSSMLGMRASSLPLSRPDMLRALRRYGSNTERCIEYCSCDSSLSEDAEAARVLLAGIRSENACYDIRELDIDGRDVMNLGFSGSAVGQALEMLLEAVICGNVPNNREELMSYLTNTGGNGDVFV